MASYLLAQVNGECPSTVSLICLDTSLPSTVECEMTSVAGRIGPSYYIELSGPESVHGAVNYVGNGVFKAEYVGPIAGVYKLEVRLCGESIEQS